MRLGQSWGGLSKALSAAWRRPSVHYGAFIEVLHTVSAKTTPSWVARRA